MVASVFGGMEQDVMINGTKSTERFSGGLFAFDNLKVPYTERLFLTTYGYMMTVPTQDFYFDGRHESSEKDGWTSSGKNT